MRILGIIFLLIFPLVEVFNQELVPASYFGSYSDLKEFIKHEMVYPDKALEDKIEGKVVLAFYIKKDGDVDHIQGLDTGSDK